MTQRQAPGPFAQRGGTRLASAAAVGVVVLALTAACSSSSSKSASGASTSTAPSSSAAPSSAAVAASTAAAPASSSPASSPASSAASSGNAAAVSTDLGSAPSTVTIESYSGGEADALTQMAALFQAAHPTVTIKITPEAPQSLTVDTPHLMASPNPPDIIRLAEFGSLVKDNLLLNLDPYAAAFGWTSWPQSQFEPLKVNASGTTGEGSLYSAGPGFVFQGVFYDKALAAKIGMTAAPTSLADFEADLAKAKAAGILPIEADGKDDGVDFPFQDLEMYYEGSGDKASSWVYDQPGASINIPSTVMAATTLQQWAKAGYFNPDVNSTDQNAAPPTFIKGQGLFFFSGSWQDPTMDKAGSGKFGFFNFPTPTATTPAVSPSATWQFGVSSKSKNATAAVAFLNSIYTDPRARQITFSTAGFFPAGPTGAAPLAVTSGSTTADAAAAFQTVLNGNGLIPFFGNATAQISASTTDPNLQLLLSGKVTPAEFATDEQSGYESELSGS